MKQDIGILKLLFYGSKQLLESFPVQPAAIPYDGGESGNQRSFFAIKIKNMRHDISQMNNAGIRERGLFFRCMVPGDGFNNGGRQTPSLGECRTDLSVIETQNCVFSLQQGAVALIALRNDLGKGCRKAGGKDDMADVMQEPGAVGCFGIDM